jgi:ferritin-like protein
MKRVCVGCEPAERRVPSLGLDVRAHVLSNRMASETYHEPYELLSAPTRDRHRAITTLIEELEAIDWYQQRADVCENEELRAVLIHNKNEEVEHAMMTLEWIRRNYPEFDANIRTYVPSTGKITEVEVVNRETNGVAGDSAAPGGSLGIGSLKGGR